MIIPSELENRIVSLSDIDLKQETFRITTNNAVEDLVCSFKRVGLINPPILMHQGTGYIVLCGYRRISAARATGWHTVPVRVLSPESNPLSRVMLAISDNTGERALNLIETSRALSLISSIVTDDETRNRIAGEVGLPENPVLLRKIEPLCRLPKPIQNGILSSDIAMPSALMLEKMPPETVGSLAAMLSKLKLSLSKQREFIDTLQEISARDDCTIEDILQSPDIRKITNDPDLNTPHKAGLIRNILKQRRFPHLSKAQASFNRFRKSLKLGNNLSLNPPPGFESSQYTITFSFSNLSDLEDHRKSLARLAKDERLKDLLSPETT